MLPYIFQKLKDIKESMGIKQILIFMFMAKDHIEYLETDGIYIADNVGNCSFIPWNNVLEFRLNIHQKRYYVEIFLKEGEELLVKISEPFLIAQRIYKILFNYGEQAESLLPRFLIT